MRTEHSTPTRDELEYQLKPGDILLFKAPTAKDIISSDASLSLIMTGQLLSSAFGKSKGGHYDTTHASICSGYDENGDILITHFTGEANAQQTLKLKDFLKGQEDRSYLIFSPSNAAERDAIIAESQRKEYTTQEYSYLGTFLSLFRKWTFRSKKETARDESTFCSAFVAKVLRFAGVEPGIATECTPKTLEAKLRKSEKFNLEYHMGANGMKDIIEEIRSEIKRLEKGSDKAKLKAGILSQIVERITSSTDYQTSSEAMKAKMLLKATLPILATHTRDGPHILSPESYRKIKKIAVRKGLSLSELTETPDKKGRKLRKTKSQGDLIKHEAHRRVQSI